MLCLIWLLSHLTAVIYVANEGELNDEYTVNPAGGVSVISTDQSPDRLTQDDVTTVDVTAEDLPEDFRPLGPNPEAYHLNAEPEYIVVDKIASMPMLLSGSQRYWKV